MKRTWLLGLLAGSHALCSAVVTETEERLSYEVRQAPGMNLLQALNQATPIRDESGRTFFGHTKWHVAWQYRHRTRGDGLCGITSVSVSLATTMTLPALKEATTEGAAQFAAYLSALVEHEQGHRRVGQEAARQVESTLTQLPAMASCALLETEANRIATQLIRHATHQDKAYDAATHYGCTQGACLPR